MYGTLKKAELLESGSDMKTWAVWLVDPFDAGQEVMCRVASPVDRDLRGWEGRLVWVRGVLLATGSVVTGDGGFTNVASLACSAVAQPVD